MSAQHFHAVIWIDHHEARVFHFNHTDVDQLVLQPENPTMHIHHKSNTIGSGHETLGKDFLHEVAMSVAKAGAILIAGPGNAKTELMKHIELHDKQLVKAIAGVETVDHPSDAQLVAYARKYFKSADGQPPRRINEK
jgi:stalled ribosome rescue protein Dom34